MAYRRSKILPFADPAARETGVVGRVHRDGSITFRGQLYPTIKDVPKDCQAIRPDVETEVQWRRLYRVIAPEARRGR
ncbi:MAG: hypothetical protein QOF89_3539 [Acidobacteriota bacterium]|jgi:hypothetical protein|nr:hypothetical protein [Acidobacteriota bacterium]